jgi:hypothetical protein
MQLYWDEQEQFLLKADYRLVSKSFGEETDEKFCRPINRCWFSNLLGVFF